jgi:hypothetical protein
LLDRRVRAPYGDKLPRIAVIYAEIGVCTANVKRFERVGNTHKRDRAAKRLRQLEAIAERIEALTCPLCGRRFSKSMDRKTHLILVCSELNKQT